MSLSVVIAPDSFKGTLAARDVAEAIARGWASVRPADTITLIPQADGGEGTLDAVEAGVPGSVRHDAGLVTGPDGRPTPGIWLELPGRIAVIELAQMSGLPLMRAPDPLGATTFGLGEVIRAALQAGMQSLLIGLGGSASTDGGAGALAALGLAGEGGRPLPRAARLGALGELGALDRSGLLPPPPGGVTLLTDVAAPLLGPTGAAAVFGPQKGASSEEIAVLDAALAHFAALLGGDPTLPGTGAAGGAGYGFVAAWGAKIEPGAAYLAALSGLPEAVAAAQVLLTGEGRFDATSGTGKLVGQLIELAGSHEADDHAVRVGVIAGQLSAQPVTRDGTPIWSVALVELAGSVPAAIADPARWLEAGGAQAARALGASVDRQSLR
ncbi:MAG: glycerate kinase family protein [Lacisediminihabitans sp.]